MRYLTTGEFGKKLKPSVSGRRVNEMCTKGQVPGAIRIGRNWAIPENAPDLRKLNYRKK